MECNWQSVVELSQELQSGKITCKELVEACWRRIQEREEQIHAWAFLNDKETLLQEAQVLDTELQSCSEQSASGYRGRSWIHGIPVALKDIVETEDMPTNYGCSPEYISNKQRTIAHKKTKDADLVKRLKKAGAIILGKTVSTEFGVSMDAPVTRNPNNISFSPGGSSSGSAAAVADGMVPFAFGAQTAGSVIRPAAFCGIFGYKTSYEKLPLDGIRPVAPSIDALGVFVRSLEDIPIIMKSIGAWNEEGIDTVLEDTSFSSQVTTLTRDNLLLAFCKTPFWDSLPEYYTKAILRTVDQLRVQAKVRDLVLPEPFVTVFENHSHVMLWEVTQVFRELEQLEKDNRWPAGATVGQFVRSIPQLAHNYGEDAYRCVLRTASLLRQVMKRPAEEGDGLLYRNELILCPSTSGEAPPVSQEAVDSLESSGTLSPVLGSQRASFGGKPGTTGDSLFQRGWTLLHCPAINIPIGRGPRGLPIGIQLVAPAGEDEHLVHSAQVLTTLLMRK
ncbi:Glutamyl-tRNA(Gln) amidotransferase subunit A [Galdieria sulphuraria]|uniref:Bifunctional aspartyl-tRNA(Asn) / glutamyl-tRNA (Gln) amidotransferase subunit A n=1 Tax=Galdieria sulphuraria TaxID=130081 RepID=M2WSR3_GALSU|nr:bifunctional aspartyl-tRNA(Asn) / glutamyl-tRNA (Gln) amidotransferase subunit A [Galdieria sulphuraria]EME26900.1 bifunctional aspartyl-tRNA(Asn) / glutamyl-tRNA (Gln) amidotransferase subunit A [Galdieria sulphuraria]GJD10633.1 Glutamyl-tRNA(Gln) amidotransferase subunit A [Galdieria sulphuraria]|eukprot:XP_005703420.1 bifunctional aspartyl-tRNA(Asn) / glutamyl-tRNA (Gln) amidotransferase subunit A [Galdieria sulphuraria]